MPDAESQGLPQGFNDDLVTHALDEAAPLRPRPESEVISDVADQIADERAAYDARHSVDELKARRDGPDARFSDAPADPDAWSGVTKRELVAALRDATPDSELVAKYDANDKSVSKAELVAAAEAAGLEAT